MSILSFLAIASSLFVVTAKSTILSIIWLVVVFILTALILGLLGLTYAALTYVIVYVGAIAILFLFVVQLLDQRNVHSFSQNTFQKSPVWVESDKVHPNKWIDQTTKNLNINNSIPLAIILGILLFLEIGSTLPVSIDLWKSNDFLLGTNQLVSFTSLFSKSEPIGSLVLEEVILEPSVANAKTNILPLETSILDIKSTFENSENQGIYNELRLPFFREANANANLFPDTANMFSIQPSNVENFLISSGQVKNLGQWLYGGASLPLIIVSVILLLAMVGPIILCWSYI